MSAADRPDDPAAARLREVADVVARRLAAGAPARDPLAAPPATVALRAARLADNPVFRLALVLGARRRAPPAEVLHTELRTPGSFFRDLLLVPDLTDDDLLDGLVAAEAASRFFPGLWRPPARRALEAAVGLIWIPVPLAAVVLALSGSGSWPVVAPVLWALLAGTPGGWLGWQRGGQRAARRLGTAAAFVRPALLRFASLVTLATDDLLERLAPRGIALRLLPLPLAAAFAAAMIAGVGAVVIATRHLPDLPAIATRVAVSNAGLYLAADVVGQLLALGTPTRDASLALVRVLRQSVATTE